MHILARRIAPLIGRNSSLVIQSRNFSVPVFCFGMMLANIDNKDNELVNFGYMITVLSIFLD